MLGLNNLAFVSQWALLQIAIDDKQNTLLAKSSVYESFPL
ncbi:Uncharacterised protein [Acinetobacter baumannii]|jgi:hypothetical protein|uniref:Uncharacterized protein n=1 Tax=Acinetobacter higginsii TaxID=70347 RepID=N9T5N9_9GAMM|nr:hypothetical protein F902_00144 [Acinetobacter higginsii]SSR40892.1 Uncharacterised protein [Acinetobacter baumannii]